MLMNTHFIMAKSILDNIDENKTFFISEKNFIYGNIKPDAFSKYKLKKHYLDESFNMIVSKINYLCSLNIDSLSKYFSVSRLSQELGVICHFLCDFFCVAHSERWEFKHSLNKHVNYERELGAFAKDVDLSKIKCGTINSSFEKFFTKLYSDYKKKTDYMNDLKFSAYTCNSVINYILDSILSNTIKSYHIANCG